jgi:DNA-binding beta-propeller fold protein YncE
MKTTSANRHLLCAALLVYGLAAAMPAFPQSRGLAKFEKAKTHFRQGMVYFNNMRYLAAVEHFRKAVAVYPDYNTAREYLARSYRLAGFRDEALTEWEFLSGIAENNVLIQHKIDMLRLQETGMAAEGFAENEFVLADEYKSADLKRFRFPNPVDVAVDAEKNIYITSFSAGKLVKFDPNKEGEAVFSPGLDSRLYGIDCSGRRLVVSDFQKDRVYIMNTRPAIVKTFGSPGNAEGRFHGPQGVCFDPGGHIYVVDSGNHRVQKFDGGGRFILGFGKQGEYEGQLQNPSDCAADSRMVYVTDSGNGRIACFDNSGNFIKNIDIGDSGRLRGIRFTGESLMVSDEKKGLFFHSLQDGTTSVFREWDGGRRGFGRLYSALMDGDRFLYCLDYGAERLFVFTPLKNRYTNYDLEISSADARKFPVVALSLGVRDQAGRPLYGLTADNFSVTEDGARMQGIYVDYLKDRPASASMVICVDRSEGMRDYHNDIPWAAEFILKKMRRDDRLKVTGLNRDLWVENDFDWSRRRALRAMRKAGYGEGKNIGKALYNAIADLVPRTNRRGVIYITDGRVDEGSFSQYTVKNVIEFSRSHFIPVYIFSFRDADPTLRKIAGDTGGALYSTRQADSFRGLYDRIKKSDEYRYVVVYSTFKSPSLKGWWAEVKIEVAYKGQKGLEWGGYFVP